MSKLDRDLTALMHDMIDQIVDYGVNYRRTGTMSKEEVLIRRAYDLLARVEVEIRDWEELVDDLRKELREAEEVVMDKTTDELLGERGERYGDYPVVACLSQTLKNVMRGSPRWRDLNPAHQESLDMVANKLARMLCGDPTYLDNIDDIIGYMTLIRRELVRRELVRRELVET